MEKFSFTCCLLILLYASLLGLSLFSLSLSIYMFVYARPGDIKGAAEPVAEVIPERHITCVYTYGCVANEAACTAACTRAYHGFNQGCSFTLPTCACACFCMTHRNKIEDCHYPPPSANAFKFDINKLGLGLGQN